ncbi:MAG: hypothetical protein ABI406_15385 [Ktedonobacteraceae bacterium]
MVSILQRILICHFPRGNVRYLLQSMAAVLAVCTLGSVLLLLAACGSQNTIITPSPGTWRVVHSTNPGTAQNNLNAVAATFATDAWAVGSFSNKHLDLQGTQALIEHWNGAAWSVVANPTTPLSDSVLNGVVALSPTNAWAVGYTFQDNASYVTQALIEHWNGASWKVVANPGPVDGAQLTAVAALTATDIWAVGYGAGGQTLGEQSLIEHWDGKKWREVQSPNPGNGFDILNGLAAVSTNDVWAVGTFTDENHSIATGEELLEHWNGASWAVVQGPNTGVQGNTLSAVAATSTNNIWAVGSSNGSSSLTETLIEHWNGKVWSNIKGQNPGQASNALSAITVLSPQNIWAVGSWSSAFTGPQVQPLIEHWNGSVWSTVKSPNIGTNTTTLNGAMLVPHSTHIWAVGTGATDGIPIAVTVPPPGAGTYNETPVTAQTLIEFCCS